MNITPTDLTEGLIEIFKKYYPPFYKGAELPQKQIDMLNEMSVYMYKVLMDYKKEVKELVKEGKSKL